MGPGLAEHLVDVAAGPDADLVLVLRVFDLDEVLAVESFENGLLAALSDFSARRFRQLFTNGTQLSGWSRMVCSRNVA